MSQSIKERGHPAREFNCPSRHRVSARALPSANFVASLILLLFAIPPLPAQTTGINEDSRLVTLPTGEKVLEWFGKTGHTYFIQVSDASDPLAKWKWAPLIESGNDEPISHEVIGSADKGFFRLQYTDQTAPDLDAADFDGDGLSNLEEITPAVIGNNTVQTNPLDPDTDHDGLSDKWERDHGLDPTDDGAVDPNNGPNGDSDGDGLTNLEEQTDGTDPNNSDTDGDGLTDSEEKAIGSNPNSQHSDNDGVPDGEDADPNEPLVDWPRISESPYVLIKVEVPEEAGLAMDLNNKGEILFSKGTWKVGIFTELPEVSEAGVTNIVTGNGQLTDYELHGNEWSFFNENGMILGLASGEVFPCPAVASLHQVALQAGGSQPITTATQMDLADTPVNSSYRNYKPLGVDAADRIFTFKSRSGSETPANEIWILDTSLNKTQGISIPDNARITGNTSVSDSGWIYCQTVSAGAVKRMRIWDNTGGLKDLPMEFVGNNIGPVCTDLPNGRPIFTRSTGTSFDTTTNAFVCDQTGAIKQVASLESAKVSMFAGDGTGMTTDGKLWRNGKLIPLRNLSTKYKELEDEGYSLFPRKANKKGVYLIATQAPDATIETKLGAPVEIEQQNYNSSKGIRFCRWLDSFTSTGSMLANAAEVDRDRFRIRIPMLVQNLTQMKIKATGLHGAMIDGAFVEKATDGDYTVDMKPENGAMVGEWILLVSDGDDDKKFNGKGIDDKSNDQTLLADFDSKIIVTFPELDNAEAEFKAQKAVGKVTLNIFYMSPAGDVPAIMRDRINLQVRKMREIYRQIGIQVAVANIKGEIFEQEYFDEVPAPQQPGDPAAQPENYLSYGECGLLNSQIRGIVVPQNQIRIGYVDARLNPLNSSFYEARGWTNQGQDGITVSLRPGNHEVLGVTAHEVGHTLGFDHVDSIRKLMKDPLTWGNNALDSKRFSDGDYEQIRGRRYYVPF